MMWLRMLLVFFLLSTYSQGVLYAQAFPSNDATWQGVNYTIIGQTLFRQLLCGDTLINGQQYAKFYDYIVHPQGDTTLVYAAAIRSEGMRSWFVRPGEQQEKLLYDFSLEQGDEIELEYVFLSGSFTLKVASVVEVGTGSDTRRQINFVPVSGFEESWVEGVGSLFGPINRGFFAIDAFSQLWCFRKGGTLEYRTVDSQQCDFEYACTLTARHEAEAPAPAFQLFPSRASEELFFVNPARKSMYLQAYGLDGRLAETFGPFSHGKHPFNCGELSPGLYVFKLVEKNNNLYLQHFKIFIAK